MTFGSNGVTVLRCTCPRGDTGWTSNESTDNDNDGCRDDSAEDPDDDNDGVNDVDENGRPLDNCPLLANADQTNTDKVNDGGDACDVDDDNNGLIEIRTLDALARLRDDLDGDGWDDGNINEINATGNKGCPATRAVTAMS